ncbi:MAG: tRNA (guanosine(46)-N7)-methyltransferase TrmB [Proteobacteria bacterium]|nr:tRNA (guanosine(46)-N7)-methyltransferase TrmB [Pseudomonadota bacterium]
MPPKKRAIRSYVLRTGRMTAGQQQAYDQGWQRWGLQHGDGPLNPQQTFGRPGPLVLEIGFGMGQSLLAMAQAAPASNFIGIEVHTPGVGKLIQGMQEQAVDNIRIYRHDAVEVLHDCIAEQSLDTVQIFFPDPWHKRKHQKRRLIQLAFVEQLRTRLKPGGLLHLATDWEDYASQMMAVLGVAEGYENSWGEGQYATRPDSRPLTKFEKRGERLGHGVWDLMFTRV